MKVSVIVPMYNVEQYLEECLQSLAAQTLQDMEVLIVNDGSTDHSPEIAQKFVSEHPDRFVLLHKPNGGLSDARNYGVRYAKGQYIAFLDSDDFVEPELYEKLLNKIEEGYDVVVTDIEYWYTEVSCRFVMKGLTDWPVKDVQKRAMLSPMFAWNKLYRADFFTEKGLAYPLNTWYEDIPVTTMIFAQTSKIGYLQECLIHYRQREGSIMQNNDSPRLVEIFGIMELLRKNFTENGCTDRFRNELEYLHVEHLRLYGMFRFIRSNHWAEYYESSQEVMRTYYPDWKKNPYIKYLNTKNRVFLQFYNKFTAFLFNKVIGG